MRRAIRDRDRMEVKWVQRELKVRIKQDTDSYRRKLEQKLQLNNVKDVWHSVAL